MAEITKINKKETPFMAKKRINLSIDEDIYKQFQEYCEDGCMVASKKVEQFMKGELSSQKEVKKK